MNKISNTVLLFISIITLVSCDDFLDEKPRKAILVPNSAADVRSLLDYYTTLNGNSLITFILSDDWVTDTPNWETLSPWQQNAYLWSETVFEPTERSTDYNRLYRKAFSANVCLDILGKMDDTTDPQIRELKGEALFLRSMALYQLGQLFLPHPLGSSAEETKIPVHFSADVNSDAEWLTVSEVMQRVESDLKTAHGMLPEKSLYRTRPDKTAVMALLSGLYLYLEDFEKSLESAQEVLNSSYSLMDYSELDADKAYPFTVFNEETLYYGVTSSFSVTASSATYINPELYSLYSDNDLRKELFFTLDPQGNALFKGSYIGDYNLFSGISYSEVLLNGAEAAVRLGEIEEGMDIIASLAKNRYRDSVHWETESQTDLLELVMAERRKELVFRGTRWADMKRLVILGELSLPLTRVIGETNYELEKESQMTVKIPSFELDLESN